MRQLFGSGARGGSIADCKLFSVGAFANGWTAVLMSISLHVVVVVTCMQ